MAPKTHSKQHQQTGVALADADVPPTPRGRTNENIFLFVPNLIGYSRVLLAAASLTYMSSHPKFCTVAYGISCLLDAVDGQAARALGQTSKFGAILDMVTDRSLVQGSSSHKSVTKKQSWILWSYYNNSRTLFLFCAGNELFFVALYLSAWYHKKVGLVSVLSAFPPRLVDTLPRPLLMALIQLTWPQVIAIVTFPICAAKQVINCVQFWKAAKVLVESDQEDRWEKLHAKQN